MENHLENNGSKLSDYQKLFVALPKAGRIINVLNKLLKNQRFKFNAIKEKY
jgi:hypothetical protein